MFILTRINLFYQPNEHGLIKTVVQITCDLSMWRKPYISFGGELVLQETKRIRSNENAFAVLYARHTPVTATKTF